MKRFSYRDFGVIINEIPLYIKERKETISK